MKLKRLVALALSGVMMMTMVGCSSEGGSKTYTATAKGFAGDVTVEVTVNGDKIEDVKATGENETEGIGSVALETLPKEIVEKQSVKIDVVATATMTSNAILEAATAALNEAGFDVNKEAEGTTGEVKEETLAADVVVIGAGGAGMSAAIEAADAGKSVIVVEKAAMTGGNTTRATGGMNAAETPEQQKNEFGEAAGIEKTIAAAKESYPELAELTATVEQQYADWQAAGSQGYFDSIELFELDTLVGGKNVNNHELVEVLATQAKDGIEWLKTVGADLSQVGSFGGASVKRIHKPVDENGKTLSVGSYLVPILEKAMLDKGVTLYTETAATEILMQDGKAVGIKATGKDANYTINTKSVVIASGGFAGNSEMVISYKSDLEGFASTNAATITGDGIKMAEAVGAALVDMEQIQIHPTVEFNSAALITEGLRGDGAILVNQDGKRFFDEVGTRDAVSAAEIAQPGGYAYLVIDQKMVDASSVIAGYIKKGFTVQGESYAELAEAIGCDAATLEETMNKWNEAVANKNDAEFGRTSFANPLDTAPYYAIKVSPGVHHTMGGIKINTNTEVLDKEGNVISNLFAAGEVTGGVHGANRLGGNAVADIVVFGRIAGQNAAKAAE